MKAAPVLAAFRKAGVPQQLIHTGQHYDAVMSDLFFQMRHGSHDDRAASDDDIGA